MKMTGVMAKTSETRLNYPLFLKCLLALCSCDLRYQVWIPPHSHWEHLKLCYHIAGNIGGNYLADSQLFFGRLADFNLGVHRYMSCDGGWVRTVLVCAWSLSHTLPHALVLPLAGCCKAMYIYASIRICEEPVLNRSTTGCYSDTGAKVSVVGYVLTMLSTSWQGRRQWMHSACSFIDKVQSSTCTN